MDPHSEWIRDWSTVANLRDTFPSTVSCMRYIAPLVSDNFITPVQLQTWFGWMERLWSTGYLANRQYFLVTLDTNERVSLLDKLRNKDMGTARLQWLRFPKGSEERIDLVVPFNRTQYWMRIFLVHCALLQPLGTFDGPSGKGNKEDESAARHTFLDVLHSLYKKGTAFPDKSHNVPGESTKRTRRLKEKRSEEYWAKQRTQQHGALPDPSAIQKYIEFTRDMRLNSGKAYPGEDVILRVAAQQADDLSVTHAAATAAVAYPGGAASAAPRTTRRSARQLQEDAEMAALADAFPSQAFMEGGGGGGAAAPNAYPMMTSFMDAGGDASQESSYHMRGGGGGGGIMPLSPATQQFNDYAASLRAQGQAGPGGAHYLHEPDDDPFALSQEGSPLFPPAAAAAASQHLLSPAAPPFDEFGDAALALSQMSDRSATHMLAAADAAALIPPPGPTAEQFAAQQAELKALQQRVQAKRIADQLHMESMTAQMLTNFDLNATALENKVSSKLGAMETRMHAAGAHVRHARDAFEQRRAAHAAQREALTQGQDNMTAAWRAAKEQLAQSTSNQQTLVAEHDRMKRRFHSAQEALSTRNNELAEMAQIFQLPPAEASAAVGIPRKIRELREAERADMMQVFELSEAEIARGGGPGALARHAKAKHVAEREQLQKEARERLERATALEAAYANVAREAMEWKAKHEAAEAKAAAAEEEAMQKAMQLGKRQRVDEGGALETSRPYVPGGSYLLLGGGGPSTTNRPSRSSVLIPGGTTARRGGGGAAAAPDDFSHLYNDSVTSAASVAREEKSDDEDSSTDDEVAEVERGDEDDDDDDDPRAARAPTHRQPSAMVDLTEDDDDDDQHAAMLDRYVHPRRPLGGGAMAAAAAALGMSHAVVGGSSAHSSYGGAAGGGGGGFPAPAAAAAAAAAGPTAAEIAAKRQARNAQARARRDLSKTELFDHLRGATGLADAKSITELIESDRSNAQTKADWKDLRKYAFASALVPGSPLNQALRRLVVRLRELAPRAS